MRNFRHRPQTLADVVPWAEGVDGEQVIRCKDGSLLAVWKVKARDKTVLSEAEQGQLDLALNTAWKRLQGRWGVWCDMYRRKARLASGEDQEQYAVPTLIERTHRETYDPDLWEQTLYLSLWLRAPKIDAIGPLMDLLYTEPAVGDRHDTAENFLSSCASIVDVLRPGVVEILPVTGGALATYLHDMVSDHEQDVQWPWDGQALDYALTDTDFVTGLIPQLGEMYLASVAVKSFPPKLWTGMLSELSHLPFGFRWTETWLHQESETNKRDFTKQQKKQSSKRYSFSDAFVMWITREKDARLENTFAKHQEKDTDAARFDLLTQDVSYGDLALAINLRDPDRSVLQEQVREVERIIRGKGLTATSEGVNAVASIMGSWPGLGLQNPRRFRLSSLNALHMAPFDDPWGGIPETPRIGAPALCLAKTNTCMPFWLTLADDDVWHTMIFGPSGSGKTAECTFLKSCFLSRYARARLRTCDFKRAARSFYLCMEAPYRDFARDRVPLQPYAWITTEQERARAFQWTMDRLLEAGVMRTPGVQTFVENGLRGLAEKPREERTMSGFRYVLSRLATARGAYGVRAETLEALRKEQMGVLQTIDAYTVHGTWGYLFDSGIEPEELAPIEAYEMQGLLKTPAIVPAVVSHRWNMIARNLSGEPTIEMLHEASRYLKIKAFREQIDEDLRLLRDKRWGLWLETQDVGDILDSDIGRMLLSNCPIRLLLPNPQATTGGVREAYEKIGLSDAEIRQVASAVPKRDIYVQCPAGRRLIHLPLTPVAQAICGSSTPEDHFLMDSILAQHGPSGFAERWLTAKGLPEAAERLRLIRKEHDGSSLADFTGRSWSRVMDAALIPAGL